MKRFSERKVRNPSRSDTDIALPALYHAAARPYIICESIYHTAELYIIVKIQSREVFSELRHGIPCLRLSDCRVGRKKLRPPRNDNTGRFYA